MVIHSRTLSIKVHQVQFQALRAAPRLCSSVVRAKSSRGQYGTERLQSNKILFIKIRASLARGHGLPTSVLVFQLFYIFKIFDNKKNVFSAV